jgi:hypothetical protein
MGMEFGDPSFPLYELFYPIDTKPLFLKNDIRISSDLAELYQNGWSLGEIAREFGCSKNKVRSRLLKSEIELRAKLAQATSARGSSGGKQGALPYYGFCYLEGEITKDPREFPILRSIHRLWKQKRTIHTITQKLNQAAYPSRKGKAWSWAAVQNIIKRFEAEKVILKPGGKYELR